MNLHHQSRTARRQGLTLVELLVLVGAVVLLALAFFPSRGHPIDAAYATALKNKGRGIWIAVVSANSERGSDETNSFWPKELGFDKLRTSTEYFRSLMCDTNGCPTTNCNQQVAWDLNPGMLSGAGVPCAQSTTQFSRTNNVWSVVCVDEETPSGSLFLITRNVDLGRQANAASVPKLTRIRPFERTRAVWVTRGGGIFDARPAYLTAARLFPSTNETYDVMYP